VVKNLIRRVSFVAGWFALLPAFTVIPAFAGVTIGQNFIASSYTTNSQALPPDSDGAIGPRHFVEFINGTFAAFNRNDPGNVFQESDIDFWANAGVLLASDKGISDPRVIYDPLSQRWFASQVDFDANAAAGGQDETLEANDFLLAFSATSDPTGDWVAFRFRADTVSNAFADFPTLGVDSNAVYLSGNMFKGELNNLGPNLVSIPKADLLNSNITTRTYFGLLDPNLYGWVLQPALCFDATTNGAILSMGDVGSDDLLHSNIFSFRVLGAGHANATLSTPVNITVDPYFCPFNSDMDSPLFNVTQPDGTTTLQANDPRFAAFVYNVGGVLYGVHNTELNGRIAIQWYRVDAATGVLLEQGTISDSNLDLFFPTIAANPNGDVIIGCNGSSATTFVSNFAYVGKTVDGVTTFGSSPLLLQAGVASYHDANEILAQLLDDPVVDSRWGDYNAISVDPNDPSQFWTIQMYASDVDNSDNGFGEGIWSTQVAQLLITTPAALLSIAPAGPNVILSWPLSTASFHLQSSDGLASTNLWGDVVAPLTTNGNQITATIPLQDGQQFFRLKQ
jgi:hypothetical protein